MLENIYLAAHRICLSNLYYHHRNPSPNTTGVGYGWVDHLKEIGEKVVTNQMFVAATNRFPHNTPTTKEGYRYRMVFEEFFPGESAEKTVPFGKSIA